jgi:hypothetical protein
MAVGNRSGRNFISSIMALENRMKKAFIVTDRPKTPLPGHFGKELGGGALG